MNEQENEPNNRNFTWFFNGFFVFYSKDKNFEILSPVYENKLNLFNAELLSTEWRRNPEKIAEMYKQFYHQFCVNFPKTRFAITLITLIYLFTIATDFKLRNHLFNLYQNKITAFFQFGED